MNYETNGGDGVCWSKNQVDRCEFTAEPTGRGLLDHRESDVQGQSETWSAAECMLVDVFGANPGGASRLRAGIAKTGDG